MDTMKRLLIISPSLKLPGGVSNYVNLLIKQFEKKEYNIKVLEIGKTHSFYKNVFYPLNILIQFFKLKKIIKEFNPDIIHMNPSLQYISLFRDFLFLQSIKKTKIPLLFFIHGWNISLNKKFKNPFFKRFLKKEFSLTSKIVVLSSRFKDELISLNISAEKIYVSSTMVESEKYYTSKKKFQRPFQLLFCSTIKKEKGPFKLLGSAPRILRLYPDTRFIFVGDGKDLELLKESAKKMGIQNQITFTGYVSPKRKIEIFKKSHIFIFPSTHGEGFPTVILEAMAAGLALITTPNAGIEDAIIDNKDGLIIKNIKNAEPEIAKKIIQLFENPSLLAEMSNNNIRRAKNEFSTQVISNNIATIYNELINANSKENIGEKRNEDNLD